MTYHISLSLVSIAVGALALIFSLPGIFLPEQTRLFLLRLPRNFWAGAVLALIGIIWTVALLMKVDLGEFSVYRMWMATAVIIIGLLMIQFLRDFLTARAVGILLLLGTEVLLSAAFPVESKSRFAITLLAYLWAIAGMIFIAAPYRFRDQIEFFNKTPSQTRFIYTFKALMGLIFIGLGLFVYS